LRRALVRSSNTYFVTNGLRPGVFARVVELGRRLHLGERIGLPLKQETGGHFPTAADIRNWPPGEKANICIGQGKMDVTPVQMAVMTAALANGGKVLLPRLVDRLESQDPTGLEPPITFPNGVVRDNLGIQPRHIQTVRDAMLAETEDPEGTGHRYVNVPGLRICGKTGTAERIEAGEKRNTTWFISYAPYDNPKYAVVVMAEDGESGGKTCGPVAADVYTALIKPPAQPKGAVARNN
jgi:penicillin-binding protein 2